MSTFTFSVFDSTNYVIGDMVIEGVPDDVDPQPTLSKYSNIKHLLSICFAGRAAGFFYCCRGNVKMRELRCVFHWVMCDVKLNVPCDPTISALIYPQLKKLANFTRGPKIERPPPEPESTRVKPIFGKPPTLAKTSPSWEPAIWPSRSSSTTTAPTPPQFPTSTFKPNRFRLALDPQFPSPTPPQFPRIPSEENDRYRCTPPNPYHGGLQLFGTRNPESCLFAA